MKIVHAADLHIDSPFRGLVRYDGAPTERVRGATRRAFENVIALCLTEEARFLILAGDVFDAGWKDASSGVYFLAQLGRLRAIGCTVLLLRGNHDFDLTQTLRFPPEHVKEFPAGAAAKKKGAATFVFEKEGVAFHGISYGTQKVPDSLLPGYPKALPDLLNIGVLHTSAAGSSEHATYAPCTVADLEGHGYAYWALGHVHEHKILSKSPWVVYPGNTQGRSVREVGTKGCVVLEVEGTVITDVRFEPTDVMRYFHVDVPLDKDDDEDELYAKVRSRLEPLVASADGRMCAARIVVRGACRANAAVVSKPDIVRSQIRADVAGLGDVWTEKIELLTQPAASIDELREAEGLIGDLLDYTEVLRHEDSGADRARIKTALEPLKKKIARHLEIAKIDVLSDEWLLDTLAQAEALLVERLTRGDG
jgi:DNA repair exonuclease SbcCD nuclease subunit